MLAPFADGTRPPVAPPCKATDSNVATSFTGSHALDRTSSDTGKGGSTAVQPLPPSWKNEPVSGKEGSKVQQILQACRDRDLDGLKDLATSEGGLIEDEVRRTAWPILLGCAQDCQHEAVPKWDSLSRHRDEDQVQLDVNRSFVYYPQKEPEKRTEVRKQELSNVIVAVLRSHPFLHYFQGYHDIVQVMLLVLGAEAARPAVARMSLLRIRDFMLPSMSGTELHLQLLPCILYSVDRDLYRHLSHTQPFFALAATLTLYAHDIEEYSDIARLFDFLLASEAAIPLYLFAVIIMSRKHELEDVEEGEPEMLYAILSKLPKPLDLEGLIRRTSELFSLHPPQSLPGRAWSRVSVNSVLKTTRDPHALSKQSLADGERMFHKQAAESKRAEVRKQQRARIRQLATKYRRSAELTGTATLVVIMAYWLRSEGGQTVISYWMPALITLRQNIVGLAQKYFGTP